MNSINREIGRVQQIDTRNNGDIFWLGNISSEADVGAWMVTLIPDFGGLWNGSIQVMRRPEGPGATLNNVGFMPSPYRRIIVNGVAADCQIEYGATVAPLTGATEVLIPAYGTSIALQITCTAGSATIYSRPVNGTTAL